MSPGQDETRVCGYLYVYIYILYYIYIYYKVADVRYGQAIIGTKIYAHTIYSPPMKHPVKGKKKKTC